MPAEAVAPVDDGDPVGWLKASGAGQGERMLPLFRRPATIVVGSDPGCDWRFDLPLAPEQLRLSWDGVCLMADLGEGPLRIAPEQAISAGGLSIVFEVLYFSDEVTEMYAPEEPPPPSKAQLYEPPRNHARDDQPTGEWPLADALAPSPDLLDRLSRKGVLAVARSLPRRRVLAYVGLAAVVVLEVALLAWPRRAPVSMLPRPPASARHEAESPPARPLTMLPDQDLEVALREGIEAYRRGRTAAALEKFTRLVDETRDPAARVMVFVLRNQGAAQP